MGAPAQRGRVYVAALSGSRLKLASQIPAVDPSSVIASEAKQSRIARALRNDGGESGTTFRYDLLLPATAATGAGGSGFWNISSGRKMTRP
ncbi:hypothetical protein ABIA00_007591 [Bradyrhizobium ottawaense]|jgi:hypothetical protein